jgi:hypothetical protein
MSYAQWRKSCHLLLFDYLVVILIFVLGVYPGLCGRVKTMYLLILYVVSLLSSRFTARTLLWYSNFLKYLVSNLLFQ